MAVVAQGEILPAYENDPMHLYDRLLAIDLDALRDDPASLVGTYFELTDAGGNVLLDVPLVLRSIGGEDYTWGQIWRRQLGPRIMLTSDTSILVRGMRWRVYRPPPLVPWVPIEQLYADDRVGHCFFNPIRAHLEERLEAAKSDETRATVRQTIERLQRYQEQYKDGIPESAVDAVAKSLRIRVSIADVFGNNKRSFNDGASWAKRFTYRNVRWNHLQLCASGWTLEQLPVREMEALRAGLAASDRSYLAHKNPAGLVTRLDTPDGRFELADPDRDVFQAARDAYCLDGAAIDAVKEPNLASFCTTACRVTSHARVGDAADDDPEDYGVLDLRAAYTQGPACGAYFQGYLSTISDVRRLMLTGPSARAFLEAHPGLYCVDAIESYECTERAEYLLDELKLFVSGTLVLPSPELLFLWDAGVRFRVRSGAWGPCIPGIDWERLGLLKKGTGPLFEGVALYKIWCGQLGHSNDGIKRQWFPGTAEWARYLRSQGYNAFFYDTDKDICVQRPAKRSPSNHQTFAFITSYTRINVLQKLLELDHTRVRAVQLDGILLAGPVPDGAATDKWVEKLPVGAEIVSEYSAEGWYGFDRHYDDAWITAPPSAIVDSVTFLEGAGGSGKSHSVLSDPGFRDVLFAAPMWSLVCFMSRRYGRAGTTVHRLAGEYLDEETGAMTKCRAYHKEFSRYPAVVFVDEATMIDSRMLNAVLETYRGKSKVIIAGDIRVSGIPPTKPPIWYQCRNRTTVFDPRKHGCAILSYTTDYRATGTLVDAKRSLRQAMTDIFLASSADDPGDDIVDARAVAHFVQTRFGANVCTVADCRAGYARGDTILVGTHELADEWTEALKDRDERYRIVRHTPADVKAAQEGEEAFLTGDLTRKKVANSVFALAFTIHSFQGKTFSEGLLWIDARRAWDYAMLYTAISRCQRLDQIRIMFE